MPRATAPTRIALKLIHGERFKAKLMEYAKPLVIKGVPQMLKELKEFYKDSDKVAIIESMLLEMIKHMQENNTLTT